MLELKAEYKAYTGSDFPAPNKAQSKPKKEAKAAAIPKEKVAKQKPAAKEKKATDV